MTKTAAVKGEAFNATFDTTRPVGDEGAELVDEERAAWYAARQQRMASERVKMLEARVARQEAFLADAKAALAEAKAAVGKE